MTTSHSRPDDGLVQEDRPAQEDGPAQQDGFAQEGERPGPVAAVVEEDVLILAPDAVEPGLTSVPEPDAATETPRLIADKPDATATNPDYRWREIQAMFVDDPRGSVERAADLARDTLRELASLLQEREQSLRSTWQDNNTGTEELRTSLRSYRALVDQVTEFSRPS